MPLQAPPPAKKSGKARLAGILGSVALLVILAVARFALNGLFNSDHTPSNPFEGTKAADYKDAEAAVTTALPAATDLGPFTKAQVADALNKVKSALLAGRVDEKMLYQHDATALKALFSADSASFIDEQFGKHQGIHFGTQIAPDYHLTGDKVRASGEITVESSLYQGVQIIDVKTNFVWVYAFTGDLKTSGDHLVSIHAKGEYIFPVEADVSPEFVGMNVGDNFELVGSNVDCTLFDQDLIALGKPKAVSGGGSGNDDDSLDPNGSMNVPDQLSC